MFFIYSLFVFIIFSLHFSSSSSFASPLFLLSCIILLLVWRGGGGGGGAVFDLFVFTIFCSPTFQNQKLEDGITIVSAYSRKDVSKNKKQKQ